MHRWQEMVHKEELIVIIICLVCCNMSCWMNQSCCFVISFLFLGALAFDLDYARWLDEHQRLINDLRASANSHLGDDELRFLVDGVMTHYDELFRLKSVGAKADVFHILSGMWKTPAERCFMWLGGFRSSELLKVGPLHELEV